MGEADTVRIYRAPEGGTVVPTLALRRSRPRSFPEWSALRRWGKLPVWEREIVGYLLRQLREQAGLSQRALAAALGVSQQAVAQAERWSANPTVNFLRRWAAACGRSANVCFDAALAESDSG